MFHLILTVDIPFPKEFVYTVKASNAWTAVARGMRMLRKELPRKRLTTYKIRVTQL